MKKIRLLSLILVVVMLAGMLTGCGETVAKKDLEADPRGYIEEAIKKSMSASPFGEIIALEDTKATAVEFEIEPTDEDEGYAKLAFTIGHDELALLAALDAEIEGEKVNAQMFVDEENFAIKMAELKDIFGKDAVGIGLKDFEKNFKESAWYKMLIIDTGLEEELKSEAGDFDIGELIEAYEKYLKDMADLAESCQEYKVSDNELEIDGKKIKCYKVESTLAKDTDEKMMKIFSDYMKEIAESMGMSAEDLGLEEDEMKEALEKPLEEIIKSTKSTYYIAKKGGAMLKITGSMKMKMDDSRYNYETWEIEEFEREVVYDMVVDFGADPEKMFEPSFKIEMDDGDSKTTMKGKSEIDVSEKSYTLAIDFDEKYHDADEAEYMDLSLDVKFVLEENGKYKLTMVPDGDNDNKVTVGGKLKVDGTKMTLTMEFDDVEDSELKEIKVNVDFNATTPKAFEYEDLMKWDEAKINDFMAQLEEVFGDMYGYDDDFYYDDYEDDFDIEFDYDMEFADGEACADEDL